MSITHKNRKTVVRKLSGHTKAYSIVTFFYRLFYKITGPFHVLPDFLIIGPGRSGTTTLFEGLMKHPCAVRPRFSGELYFWNANYTKGINYYRGYFPFIWKKYLTILRKGTFVTGESTPYIREPYVPKRIKKIIPNVKLIVLFRNPVDRTYSQYNTISSHGFDPLSFEEAIEQHDSRIEEERKKMEKDEYYCSLEHRRFSYLYQSTYVDQLKNWLNYFPREQFFIIDGNEFYADPPKIFAQLHEFLGLPKFLISKYERHHQRKYAKKMDPNTRKKLIEYFKPYNERLFELIGRKFDWDN